MKLGDIIPADARLLDGDPLKIDQVGKRSDTGNYSPSSRISYFLVYLKFGFGFCSLHLQVNLFL